MKESTKQSAVGFILGAWCVCSLFALTFYQQLDLTPEDLARYYRSAKQRVRNIVQWEQSVPRLYSGG